MKKENSRKLALEKFKIAILNNPETIKGGTDTSDGNNGETQTEDKGGNSSLLCTSTNTNG